MLSVVFWLQTSLYSLRGARPTPGMIAAALDASPLLPPPVLRAKMQMPSLPCRS